MRGYLREYGPCDGEWINARVNNRVETLIFRGDERVDEVWWRWQSRVGDPTPFGLYQSDSRRIADRTSQEQQQAEGNPASNRKDAKNLYHLPNCVGSARVNQARALHIN